MVYPTKLKWATKIPLGSNPRSNGPSTNSQVSNYLATSLKCNRILTQTFTTEKWVCMNCFLLFCSKKEDQYRYCWQNSKTKSWSVTNLGNKKGIPSKTYNLKYVYLYSIYSFPFPYIKSLASLAIGVGTYPMKNYLHIFKNESWIW